MLNVWIHLIRASALLLLLAPVHGKAACYLEEVGLSCPPGTAFIFSWNSWGLEASLSRGAARDADTFAQGTKLVPGAELIFARAPGPHLRFEAGFAYRPVQFNYESNSITISRVVMPMSIGVEFFKKLAIMGGGFIGTGVGDVSVETPSGTTQYTFPGIGLNKFDFGYSASALLQVPLMRKLNRSLRANYIQSVVSVATDSEVYLRNVTGLIGLRWETR